MIISFSGMSNINKYTKPIFSFYSYFRIKFILDNFNIDIETKIKPTVSRMFDINMALSTFPTDLNLYTCDSIINKQINKSDVPREFILAQLRRVVSLVKLFVTVANVLYLI